MIPPSLNLRCPIGTSRAKDIVERAKKSLLKERIHNTSRVITSLTADIEDRRTKLRASRLATVVKDAAFKYLEAVRETEFNKAKSRQCKKLTKLVERGHQKHGDQRTREEPNINTDKWVRNTTDRVLTADEKNILARGLNFAISPEKIPANEFILATEMAVKSLGPTESAALRNEVAGILKSAKPPKSNISKGERKALGTLAKDKNIMILPADKGRCTVVMDPQKYKAQVKEMLADQATYKVLTKDPTPAHKRKLIAMLQRLRQETKITESDYNHLYPTAEGLPRMYCTPKIHKQGVPLRPIVDCTGAIFYQVSKALVEVLRPLVGLTEQHCKNSAALAKELVNVRIEDDEELISHDVVSLFTKTPVQATLEIVRRRLQDDRTLPERTNINVEDIMELLTFVTSATYFQFDGVIYSQIEGFAMGNPMSAILSNLFMEDLESKAIPSAPEDVGLSLWKRYVDDTLEKIKRGQVIPLTEHLNSIDVTGNIKFTYDQENEGKLAFLDVLLSRRPDGSIKLQIYRKPTHTDAYLMFDSHHPVQHKFSVIRTLLGRNHEIVTEEADRVGEEALVVAALKNCTYPEWAISKIKADIAKKQGEPPAA